jgi:hypothetical protein
MPGAATLTNAPVWALTAVVGPTRTATVVAGPTRTATVVAGPTRTAAPVSRFFPDFERLSGLVSAGTSSPAVILRAGVVLRYATGDIATYAGGRNVLLAR